MVSKYPQEARKHLGGADFASAIQGSFEFKKVFAMPIARLQHLEGAVVEVEIEVGGALRSIRGKARYDAQDPDLGPALRILVSDPSGNFELLIAAHDFQGRLDSSDIPGCAYRISLANCTTC